MDDETLQQLAVLAAFCLLMLLLNLKSSTGTHWTTSLLRFGSFWLLIAAIGVLVWRVAGVVL